MLLQQILSLFLPPSYIIFPFLLDDTEWCVADHAWIDNTKAPTTTQEQKYATPKCYSDLALWIYIIRNVEIGTNYTKKKKFNQ